jgi:hypothetical protein
VKTEDPYMSKRKVVVIQRDVLLIEIDRHCFFADCNARVMIGLTKQEALDYYGFECTACERWNDDRLTRKDVPDWWSEIEQNRNSTEPWNDSSGD